MTLREKQSAFALAVAKLIIYADSIGYHVTFGDAYATSGHIEGSFHYKRLAVDLNLFNSKGDYLTSTTDHLPLGEYWEKMGGTWGGRFKRQDGNHYSWGEI